MHVKHCLILSYSTLNFVLFMATEKKTRNCSVCVGILWKITFKNWILRDCWIATLKYHAGSRLYSSLFIKFEGCSFSIHFSVVFFPAKRVYLANLKTNVLKITKINWASSSQATSFKLGEYNLLPITLTLRFTNCAKLNFGKGYLPCIGFPWIL